MLSFNLVFIDRSTIWRLNKKYRQVDRPTTVLTFYYGMDGVGPVGEILICPAEAKKQKISIERLIVHGLNNLLSEVPTAERQRAGFS